MKGENDNQELQGISDWFISANDEKSKAFEQPEGTRAKTYGVRDKEYEVDELITVRRRITVPNTEEGQNSMKELLQKHLEARYTLFRVELRRTKGEFETKAGKSIREEVIMLRKDSPS
jgi:hypothetical protein